MIAPIRDRLISRESEMLEELEALVSHETPSRDKAALDRFAEALDVRLRGLGAEVERLANPSGGDHILARFAGTTGSAEPPALVLCHFDTVWPSGTVAGRPFRVEGGRAYGPGVLDMKASLVLVASALGALRAAGATPPRPVLALFTSDEEIGSPTSRGPIEGLAPGCAYALVMEPALPGGRLKTARKGVGNFSVAVEGRAAHAGVEPEKGATAIVELAAQILAIRDLADPPRGTTLNVGLVRGGTATNTIAAHASADLDVRVALLGEANRMEHALRSLAPKTPGTRVSVAGGFHRPPMERTPGIVALFERARSIGRSLGLDLGEGSTGGGSDGNFTAALGVPTLDGLGALGEGAHADHEHIIIRSLPERTALLAALLLEL
jgi:glutamate carboxypeptidase